MWCATSSTYHQNESPMLVRFWQTLKVIVHYFAKKSIRDQEYIERGEGCGKKAFYCVQKRRRKDSCEAAKALHVLLAQAMHFCVWKCWSTTREPCSSSRTDYDGFSQKSLKTFFFTLLGVADFYVTTRYPASHYIKFFKSPPFNRSHFLKSSLGTL